MYGIHRYGKDAPNFGKHHTNETKEKMRIALSGKNNHNFGKRGDETPMFGKHHSPESKEKIEYLI
jgi:hypothetical protein